MFVWLTTASLALAAPTCTPADHAGWIESVRTKGEEDAYLCLAADDTAQDALLEAISASDDTTTGSHRRMQRALAIHVMQRLESPANIDALRAINASDRRLLRDAVHARRGRQSPVPDHHTVFSKFDWYQPDKRFTNRSLTPTDHENLAVIDKPPRAEPAPAPADAPAMAAVPEAPGNGPQPAATRSTCGCAATTTGAGVVWLGGLLVVGARRRQR